VPVIEINRRIAAAAGLGLALAAVALFFAGFFVAVGLMSANEKTRAVRHAEAQHADAPASEAQPAEVQAPTEAKPEVEAVPREVETPGEPPPVVTAAPAPAAPEPTVAEPERANGPRRLFDPATPGRRERRAPAAPPASAAAPSATPTPAASPAPPPGRVHALQVGAFQSEDNARKLTATLQGKGLPASLAVNTDSAGKTWYVVRIGRYEDRAAALAAQADLKNRENLATMVVGLDPGR